MEKKYLDRLSDKLKLRVTSIENHVRLEIKVIVDRTRKSMCFNFPIPPKAFSIENPPTIKTPSEEYFRDFSVLHELLHMESVLKLGIPIIDEDFDGYEYITAVREMDNVIEHLSIVPIEIKQIIERKEYWRNKLDNEIHNLTDKNYGENIKIVVFLQYMFAREILTAEDNVNKELCKIAEMNCFTDEFKELRKQLKPLINSKEEFIRILLDKFEIPSDKLVFYYYNTSLNKWTKKNIHTSVN